MRISAFTSAVAAVAVLAAPASSQQCTPDPAAAGGVDVPAPASVVGHALGDRFTRGEDVVAYAEALAAASPAVRVERYGETAEGRPLLRIVVTRPDRFAGLDGVLAANRRLAEPTTPEAEARRIARSNPAVVYFSYGVHGNESSSTEAALYTLWDLVRGAPGLDGVLDSLVVVIDPNANPDGRARYVDWYAQASGVEPNPRPAAREHWEPWPGGRYNHYLFDLNRDWAWQTQPETRARLAGWDHWTPEVHVDFHEMGWTSSYFFFPVTAPINPIYPPHILTWGAYFGTANANAFDRCGWEYYTAESYDLFYPGYGDSYPSLLGAIGMTYEQAGNWRAGLAIERPDGRVLTLTDRAQHHRVTGEATLAAAAASKTRLLDDFAAFHRSVGEGEDDFLLVPDRAGRADALVALLARNGIRVERATRGFAARARAHAGFEPRREFPAGTYLVRARQPRGRLAVTLLQPETTLRANFSYDISAWSLPYAYDVPAYATREAPSGVWTAVDTAALGGDRPAGTTVATPGGSVPPYGLLLRPSLDSWRGVIRLLRHGGRGRVLTHPFTLGGVAWPAGTIFIPRAGNADLLGVAGKAGLLDRATAVHSGLTPQGADLGTEEAIELRLPRVGLLMSDDVYASSYGAHWFFLERTLGLTFDALPVATLAPRDLARYDVLVVPDGREPADSMFATRLAAWVRDGGTLVAVADAAARVASDIADIELREEPEDSAGREQRLERALRTAEQREQTRWESEVPGTVLPVVLDPANPLAFGVGEEDHPDRLFVLHSGTLAFEPDTDFETVGYFPPDLRATSGVISDDNLDLLSRATWLASRRMGAGHIVLFADDPLFRHFWYSTFLPYVNALMLVGTS